MTKVKFCPRCRGCRHRRPFYGYEEWPACQYSLDEGKLRGTDPGMCPYYTRRKQRLDSGTERAIDRIFSIDRGE